MPRPLLNPRVAVPIHWGTLASPRARPADPELPAREFARFARSYVPPAEVRILHPGEHTHLDD